MLSAGRINATIVLFVMLITLIPCAVTAGDGFADAASKSLLPFLAAGEWSLYSSEPSGKSMAMRGAETLLATAAATEVLKRLTQEERPDGSDHYSFPSGHAALSFAMATTLSEYQPHRKTEAYCAAVLISWSRVELDKHHWHDVAAGAALGYFTAKKLARKNITLAPNGIAFQARF